MGTLDKVLKQTLKDKNASVFTLNSVEDRCVALAFLFTHSKCVKMFSRDLTLFYQGYLENIQKSNEGVACTNQFIDSLKTFLSESSSKLNIVADEVPADFIDSFHSQFSPLFLNGINEGRVIVKKMTSEISKVANLGSFIVCNDINATCFDQESNMQLMSIYYVPVVERALKVFDAFFALSEEIDVESNTKD